MQYNMSKIIGDVMVCTDFKMLEVKVPISFSGTQGFPARKVFRHAGIDVTLVAYLCL